MFLLFATIISSTIAAKEQMSSNGFAHDEATLRASIEAARKRGRLRVKHGGSGGSFGTKSANDDIGAYEEYSDEESYDSEAIDNNPRHAPKSKTRDYTISLCRNGTQKSHCKIHKNESKSGNDKSSEENQIELDEGNGEKIYMQDSDAVPIHKISLPCYRTIPRTVGRRTYKSKYASDKKGSKGEDDSNEKEESSVENLMEMFVSKYDRKYLQQRARDALQRMKPKIYRSVPTEIQPDCSGAKRQCGKEQSKGEGEDDSDEEEESSEESSEENLINLDEDNNNKAFLQKRARAVIEVIRKKSDEIAGSHHSKPRRV